MFITFSGPSREPAVFVQSARRLYESTDFKGPGFQNPSLLGYIFRSLFGPVLGTENGSKMVAKMGPWKTLNRILRIWCQTLGGQGPKKEVPTTVPKMDPYKITFLIKSCSPLVEKGVTRRNARRHRGGTLGLGKRSLHELCRTMHENYA